MAQPSGQELLARIRRSRQVDVSGDAAPERLEQIYRFLKEHEARSRVDCTHEVLSGYQDWWVSASGTKQLAIVEDNTLNIFYRHIATMYEMGFPLTLGEKRSDQFALFQDVEIKGTTDARINAEDLIGENSRFMVLLGQTMQELFSSDGVKELDVVTFDGSGECTQLGIQQTHVRLVWPQIVVDKHAAGEIIAYIAHKFESTEHPDPELQQLAAYMRTFHQDNTWRTAFAISGYLGSAAIRMPLADNVAMSPLQKFENRPLKPMGIYRFQFSGPGHLPGLERIATGEISEHTLSGHEWVKCGMIRRDADSKLTSWKRPTWSGAPPRVNSTNGANGMSTGTAPPRGGRVVIRDHHSVGRSP